MPPWHDERVSNFPRGFFSSFSRLMEAARCMNESIQKTSRSSTINPVRW